MSITHREWVPCPICGESDMEKVADGDDGFIINCVNLECASNGGTNADALYESRKADAETIANLKVTARRNWLAAHCPEEFSTAIGYIAANKKNAYEALMGYPRPTIDRVAECIKWEALLLAKIRYLYADSMIEIGNRG